MPYILPNHPIHARPIGIALYNLEPQFAPRRPGAAPSIGTVGDGFGNAMAQSVMELFKTELHRNPAALADNGGPWRGLDDLEITTCAWVPWLNEEAAPLRIGGPDAGRVRGRPPSQVRARCGLRIQTREW